MFKIAASILLIFLFSSCSKKLDRDNAAFLQQYGKEVSRINKNREAVKIEEEALLAPEKSSENNSWQDPDDMLGVSGINKYKSAYIDTSQIKVPKPREETLPNMDTFLRNRNYHRLPDNMFVIQYNMINYPVSYKKAAISFDDIVIPALDLYGVETNLGEKNYLLLDNKVLQSNVDYINSITTKDDRDIRNILVKEQKELDRKAQVAKNNKSDDTN